MGAAPATKRAEDARSPAIQPAAWRSTPGSFPLFHLMLQPMLAALIGIHLGVSPETASIAARKSFPVTGIPLVRPAVIELAAIDQLPRLIEQEEVGRAGGRVSLRH